MSIEFRVADGSDGPELRRLLRENPLDGDIRVSLEREPDVFFAAKVEGDEHQTIVAHDRSRGRTIGMGSRSVYSGFLNGRPARIGYLSQLRLDREYRGRVPLLSRGYALIRSLRQADAPPFDITTITAGNSAARRLLSAGVDGLPAYQELEPFTTLAIPTSRRRRSSPPAGIRIERGSTGRLDAIVACLDRNRVRYHFAPRWTADDLRSPERSRGLDVRDFLVALREERVIGCLAVWDQSSFKQVVVRGYSGLMRRTRPLADLFARVAGAPGLPAPGQAMPHLYLSHVAIDEDSAEIFDALFAAAYNAICARRRAWLIAGFAPRHPFLQALRKRYRAWSYSTVIYAVCWDDRCDAIASLDHRIPHLEVGLL